MFDETIDEGDTLRLCSQLLHHGKQLLREAGTFKVAEAGAAAFSLSQTDTNMMGELPSGLIKHGELGNTEWRFLARKITDFYGPCSSTPCLITGG